MTGPLGNSEFCFPRISMFPSTSSWETMRYKIHCSPRDQSLSVYYYSFKIFPRFWLVKTTRMIHHNPLLFTKFGKNLRHIESMTSRVQPVENYWTDGVKMTSKVQPAADYWFIDRENLGTRLCYIWWAEKQSGMAKLLKERGNILNDKAIIEIGFRSIWRILQISEGVIDLGIRPLWITSSLICRILHILLGLIQ